MVPNGGTRGGDKESANAFGVISGLSLVLVLLVVVVAVAVLDAAAALSLFFGSCGIVV